MVSPICRHQAKLVKESSSSPEATLAELSSVEQEVHRLNGILMLVLLPVLKHAVKTLVRQSSDFTRIDPGDAAIATAAATFGLAKLGLILKTGHVASRTELADQLWQSGNRGHIVLICWHFWFAHMNLFKCRVLHVPHYYLLTCFASIPAHDP